MYLAGAAIERRDRRGRAVTDNNFMLLFNAHHEAIPFVLPQFLSDKAWWTVLDTAAEDSPFEQRRHERGQPLSAAGPLAGAAARDFVPMSKRATACPSGRELTASGAVRFRLWAPGAHARSSSCCSTAAAARSIRCNDCAAERVVRAHHATRRGPASRYRYRIDGETEVPDPASRCNPQDVHGPSEVIDPRAFEWDDDGWRGRPWHEAVIYELHVGTFSPEGTFAGAEARLEHLEKLGVTVIELMPIADFPGTARLGL